MALLSLVVLLVSLWIGRGKGIALYTSAAIVFYALTFTNPHHSHNTPFIVGISYVIAFVGILIQQWKGFVFWCVGHLVLIAALVFSLL